MVLGEKKTKNCVREKVAAESTGILTFSPTRVEIKLKDEPSSSLVLLSRHPSISIYSFHHFLGRI